MQRCVVEGITSRELASPNGVQCCGATTKYFPPPQPSSKMLTDLLATRKSARYLLLSFAAYRLPTVHKAQFGCSSGKVMHLRFNTADMEHYEMECRLMASSLSWSLKLLSAKVTTGTIFRFGSCSRTQICNRTDSQCLTSSTISAILTSASTSCVQYWANSLHFWEGELSRLPAAEWVQVSFHRTHFEPSVAVIRQCRSLNASINWNVVLGLTVICSQLSCSVILEGILLKPNMILPGTRHTPWLRNIRVSWP